MTDNNGLRFELNGLGHRYSESCQHLVPGAGGNSSSIWVALKDNGYPEPLCQMVNRLPKGSSGSKSGEVSASWYKQLLLDPF